MKRLKPQKNILSYGQDFIIYDKRINEFVDYVDVFERAETEANQKYLFLQKVGIDKTKRPLYVGDIVSISGISDDLYYFDLLKSKLILRCLNFPKKVFNYYFEIEKLITKIGNVLTFSIAV